MDNEMLFLKTMLEVSAQHIVNFFPKKKFVNIFIHIQQMTLMSIITKRPNLIAGNYSQYKLHKEFEKEKNKLYPKAKNHYTVQKT